MAAGAAWLLLLLSARCMDFDTPSPPHSCDDGAHGELGDDWGSEVSLHSSDSNHNAGGEMEAAEHCSDGSNFSSCDCSDGEPSGGELADGEHGDWGSGASQHGGNSDHNAGCEMADLSLQLSSIDISHGSDGPDFGLSDKFEECYDSGFEQCTQSFSSGFEPDSNPDNSGKWSSGFDLSDTAPLAEEKAVCSQSRGNAVEGEQTVRLPRLGTGAKSTAAAACKAADTTVLARCDPTWFLGATRPQTCPNNCRCFPKVINPALAREDMDPGETLRKSIETYYSLGTGPKRLQHLLNICNSGRTMEVCTTPPPSLL